MKSWSGQKIWPRNNFEKTWKSLNMGFSFFCHHLWNPYRILGIKNKNTKHRSIIKICIFLFLKFVCFSSVFFMKFHFFVEIKHEKTKIPTTSIFQFFFVFFCSKSFREPFFLSQDLCHLYRKKSLLKQSQKITRWPHDVVVIWPELIQVLGIKSIYEFQIKLSWIYRYFI